MFARILLTQRGVYTPIHPSSHEAIKVYLQFLFHEKTQETCRFRSMTEDRFVKSLPENAYLIV